MILKSPSDIFAVSLKVKKLRKWQDMRQESKWFLFEKNGMSFPLRNIMERFNRY